MKRYKTEGTVPDFSWRSTFVVSWRRLLILRRNCLNYKEKNECLQSA